MRVTILFAFLFAIPTVQGLSWDANFHIIGNTVAVDYNIRDVGRTFFLNLPADSRAIELNGQQAGQQLLIERDSKITYLFSSALQRTDKGYFLFDFVTPVDVDRLDVSVWLPEGAWLEAAYPKSYNTTTDGRIITISWSTALIKNNSLPIFVIFREKTFDWSLIWAGIAVAGGLVGFYAWQRRKKLEKPVAYLLEDEKKIVELLKASPNKMMKQKELWRATGWSKAKLSRTIRRLQERGLIDVRPYGNTNLVSLKKA